MCLVFGHCPLCRHDPLPCTMEGLLSKFPTDCPVLPLLHELPLSTGIVCNLMSILPCTIILILFNYGSGLISHHVSPRLGLSFSQFLLSCCHVTCISWMVCRGMGTGGPCLFSVFSNNNVEGRECCHNQSAHNIIFWSLFGPTQVYHCLQTWSQWMQHHG